MLDNEMTKPIRVLIAKPGLDGHDRGAIIIAMGLRDEGMEVIYTGIRQSIEGIVQACIQEDVDVLGFSVHTGGHLYYILKVIEQLGEKGMNDVLVVAGGIIPQDDIPLLKEKGVAEVFGPGTPVKDIAGFIRQNTKR